MMKENTERTSDLAGGQVSAFGSGRCRVERPAAADASRSTRRRVGTAEKVSGVASAGSDALGNGAFSSIVPQHRKIALGKR
jgi:hypothetical protein